MLGQSSGLAFQQSYQPHVYNEPSWSLAKYTSLSGSQKVNIEGNVRAVFSMHRRQLAVWNENVIVICIDLHHSKTAIPTKEKYAIVKENNVSLCRLKFRSLADRVSFGAALADLVPVANDKCASQDVSSQGWQGSSQGASSSQTESVSSQGRSEPQGTVLVPDMECLPRPSRVSTPLSTIQISPSDQSPWRCYFNKTALSPIPHSTENESTFKIPTLGRSMTEKKTTICEEELEERNENDGAGEGYAEGPTPIGDPREESAILKSFNESMELFDDDNSRSRSEIGETVPFNLENWMVKKDDSIELFGDDDDDDSIETESGKKKEEEEEEPDEDRKDEGEWGMTRSFIERLRELPEKKGLKEGAVVRVKADRALMHGQDCPCCKDYYDALGLDEGERRTRVDNVSRHRYVARPMPETPPHYWEMDFPSEEEQRKRGLLRNP